MKVFISPHQDDETLFGAFTLLREKPLVVTCLDSYIQPNRGEVGCSSEERAAETAEACKALGCEVVRLGIRDDLDTGKMAIELIEALMKIRAQYEPSGVYAPQPFMWDEGNNHHTLVGVAAQSVFKRVRLYTTYRKTALYTTGDIEIVPTPEELEMKAKALDCYKSQLRINKAHFEAVKGKSEWLLA